MISSQNKMFRLLLGILLLCTRTMGTTKLAKLRSIFADEKIVNGKPIQAYLLPSTDAHQSEYLADNDFRVRFLSGFSGSNAYVVVTNEKALLWTDGRYFVQADKELEEGWSLMKQGQPDSVTPQEWLTEHLNSGDRVGFDPQLHEYDACNRLIKVLSEAEITMVPISGNLVDHFWENRPAKSDKKVVHLQSSEHGRDTAEKLKDVRQKIAKKKCTAVVFSELDDIMWLLNIRGFDIPYNPLVYSVCLVTMDKVILFVDTKKIDSDVRQHLAGVDLHEYEEAEAWIKNWHSSNRTTQGHRVFVPTSTNFALGSIFEGKIVTGTSPVQIMKAVKNPTELIGMREASIRDSAALIEFLHWLEGQVENGTAVSEAEAGKKVDGLRAQQPKFVDLSFGTISASGDHAALPHYHADTESGKRPVNGNQVFLLDSGGHYRDGTTDVTRTVWNGDAPDEFKEHNTLVLMGHIDNALAIFPEQILGVRLDTLARNSLWQYGLDFGHGTGHGVGHFLNVHEGPAGIGFRIINADGGIKAGMILTIEPGYYLPGKWGIRIENCYEVIAAEVKSKAKNFLTFRSLTLVPIQKEIIKKELLEPRHTEWLNSYHARVESTVGPYLEKTGKTELVDWLKKACSPI